MLKAGFIKWKYLLYFFPIHFVIIIFLSTPIDKVFAEFPKWLFVVVTSYLIMAMVFALVMQFNSISSNGKREFIALIAIGAIRGFAILDIGLLLNLPQVKPYLLRPLNSAVTVPLSFLVLRHLIGSRREFKELFQALYVENIKVRLDHFTSEKAKIKESEIDQIEAKVLATLDPLRREIERVSGIQLSSSDLRKEVMIIQSFIEERLRPLSHDLWRAQKLEPPRLRYLESLYRLFFLTKSQFGYAIIPSFVFSVVAGSTIETFAFAWRHALLHLIIQVIVFLAFEFIYQRSKSLQKYLNLTAVLMCISIPLVFDLLLISNYQTTPSNLGAEMVSIGWFLLLSLTFTVAKAQSDYRIELISILQKNLERDSILAEDSQIAEQYAKYLHGDIQSTLSAAQMQLQTASDSGDLSLGKATIEKLASVLRRDHHDYVIGDAISPFAKFQQIIDAWDGIATISVDIEEGNFPDPSLLKVSQILEELVSNSIRHGKATEIYVSVRNVSDGNISVSFFDNGAPMKEGRAGLGSALLRQHALEFKSDRKNGTNIIEITL
jgi:signal transduction histidine kinase